jgi:hypothetical protein
MPSVDFDDGELAADVVGVTSARLLAAGVPANRRLTALRVLGVLGSVCDSDRRVRRPLPTVAHEFGIGAREAATAVTDLISVGVVSRDGDAFVLNGAEPPAAGGIRLQDFLALADDLADQRHRRTRAAQLLRPAGVALVAAALIGAVVLAPSPRHDAATRVSSSADKVAAGPDSTAPAKTAASATTTERAAGRTGTPGATAVPGATPTCPPGGPVLEVLHEGPDLNGNLTVDGLARNTTDRPLTIRTFTIQASVNGSDVSAPGTMALPLVPAHSTVAWSATFPGALVPPDSSVRAVLGDWDWQGAGVPSDCTDH